MLLKAGNNPLRPPCHARSSSLWSSDARSANSTCRRAFSRRCSMPLTCSYLPESSSEYAQRARTSSGECHLPPWRDRIARFCRAVGRGYSRQAGRSAKAALRRADVIMAALGTSRTCSRAHSYFRFSARKRFRVEQAGARHTTTASSRLSSFLARTTGRATIDRRWTWEGFILILAAIVEANSSP
jgi:hypothetical protein